LSPEEFRLKLACLIDNSIQTEGVKQNLINEAVDFVSELPKLYSDDLDRMAMWDRIGNGMVAAVAKCNGDIDLFLNQLLSYIKAEPSKVACNERIAAMLHSFITRDKAWKDAFIRQFQEINYRIIIEARQVWNSKKGVRNA
jgi:hypothetical protein